MNFIPTAEQSSIIDAPLGSQCVTACAGSGKTATAVCRLAAIRRLVGAARGHVALLSYSNTAVDTFRREYSQLASAGQNNSGRVLIATVDSFIAGQILLSHGAVAMGCNRRPFLVRGHEPFLSGHTVFNGKHGVPISSLRISVDASGTQRFMSQLGHAPATPIAPGAATAAIAKLSKTGAYTYETGRYWVLRILREHERFGAIVATRFPHILVDEAQDIGSVHGAILKVLCESGATISLIGDAHQSIFEFADADGSFLTTFASEVGTAPLTVNRRSVTAIVQVANSVSGTSAISARCNPERPHGAYFFHYDPKKVESVPAEFSAILVNCGYALSEGAILCRGRALLERLGAGSIKRGKGVTEQFALAAIARDSGADAIDAFEGLVNGVSSLLTHPPQSLRSDLLDGSTASPAAPLRRLLWRFLRDSANGLPAASLPAKDHWQPQLKARLPGLLKSVRTVAGYESSPTWTTKITVAGLGDAPLLEANPSTVTNLVTVRTVHDVKGEGICAVLYLAKKSDLVALLKGPTTEDGRIGYVAITRARDLLFVGIPKGAEHLVPEIATKGIGEWDAPASA